MFFVTQRLTVGFVSPAFGYLAIIIIFIIEYLAINIINFNIWLLTTPLDFVLMMTMMIKIQ